MGFSRNSSPNSYGLSENNSARGKKQTSVLLDTSRYFFSTSRYFLVLPGTSQYFLVLLGTSLVLLGTSWYFLVLLCTSWYFSVLLGTSRYFSILLCTYVSKTEKKYLTLGIPNNRTKMFREWEVSITEYFCSVLWAKIKWNDVYFSRTSQYFLVLLGTSSYFSRTSWYFSVLLSTS